MRTKMQLLLFVVLFVFGCKNLNDNSTSKNIEIQTKSNDTTLPYWTDSLDRFSDAYIDTFSVGLNRFRFLNPANTYKTGGNFVILQVLEKSKWVDTKLILNDNIHGGNYFHNKDVNGDGFIDITNNLRFVQEVYFFNPTTNQFMETPSSDFINPDWTLIDTSKKIFCDFQEFKGKCGQIHSTLYTYNGFRRIYLYDLELYNCTKENNKTNIITKLILSKYEDKSNENLYVIKQTNLNIPLDTENDDCNSRYFDYKKYWLKIYKSL